MSIHKISNPLTVIGVFAGLTEVGGSIMLPLLSGQTQALYVWFLMLFPSGLVLLFFITLWANHKSLYGPGDFANEEIARLFLSKEPQSTKERESKAAKDLGIDESEGEDDEALDDSESDESSSSSSASSSSSSSEESLPSRHAVIQQYMILEDRALDAVGQKIGREIQRQVAINVGAKRIRLDGMAEGKENDVGVEIKTFNGRGNAYQRAVPLVLTEFESINAAYKTLKGKPFVGIFVFVLQGVSDRALSQLKNFISEQTPRYKVNVRFLFVREEELMQLNKAVNWTP